MPDLLLGDIQGCLYAVRQALAVDDPRPEHLSALAIRIMGLCERVHPLCEEAETPQRGVLRNLGRLQRALGAYHFMVDLRARGAGTKAAALADAVCLELRTLCRYYRSRVETAAAEWALASVRDSAVGRELAAALAPEGE